MGGQLVQWLVEIILCSKPKTVDGAGAVLTEKNLVDVGGENVFLREAQL